MRNRDNKNNGFVLLLAVLISSVILASSLGVARIINREILLASVGRDSQEALFAADSGSDCAVYWNHQGAFDISSRSTDKIKCNSFELENDVQNPLLGQNTAALSNININNKEKNHIGGTGRVSIFAFDLDSKRCAVVSVEKSIDVSTSILTTTITSHGFNVCDSSIRKVERTLETVIFDRVQPVAQP